MGRENRIRGICDGQRFDKTQPVHRRCVPCGTGKPALKRMFSIHTRKATERESPTECSIFPPCFESRTCVCLNFIRPLLRNLNHLGARKLPERPKDLTVLAEGQISVASTHSRWLTNTIHSRGSNALWPPWGPAFPAVVTHALF